MVSEPDVFIENPLFDLAEKFIQQTSRSIFLTGKAGTGKTTFLKKIKALTRKNTVVVAPTGVAAINAGGTTIHSFFQLPFTPFVPAKKGIYDRSLSDRYTLLQNIRIEAEKRNMFRDLELLIIDEVSMVRCDVLDSIDIVLRHFRRKENVAFGGVQVLFIGDLFQLPPVVQHQEWGILQEFYRSPFFFDAHVMKEADPVYIELKKVFRQRDEDFIEILNRVRCNEVRAQDIETLNKRYDPDFDPGEEKYITLSTHNHKADKINVDKLAAIAAPEHYFEASVEGDFPERVFPTERLLMLKAGAQVMFIKNDLERIRRYYNGKIGTISRIEEGKIYVVFPGDDLEMEVEKDTWRNMRYSYLPGDRSIQEEVIGTFTQYPLRLAWAITIHKSQGLTFENAIIDAGSSFASGQVYVALSRCTSLQGLVLRSRIFRQAIMTDERVLEFADNELSESRLKPMLEVGKQQYIVDKLLDLFDFGIIRDELRELRLFVESRKSIDKEEAFALLDTTETKLVRQQEIADKFSDQLRGLVLQQDYEAVRRRVRQGTEYFQEFIEKEVIQPLEEYRGSLRDKKKVRKYMKNLDEALALVRSSRELFGKALAISAEIGRSDG